MSKLISTFQIRFDDETKAEISELKNKLDEVNKSLNARDGGFWLESKRKCNSRIGQIIADAISKQIKETVLPDGLLKEKSPPDGLLKAMQAEAANDAPITSTPWENDINRETVNDVDYLSGSDLDECVPHIDDVLDQRNWLSESVPQITQADMQLIFIKNLSETLIQRMHSMDRFSEDDYAIGGDKLMAWDIVFDQVSKFFGVVINANDNILSAFFLAAHCEMTGGGCARNFHKNSLLSRSNRTITEAELPAFRAALEACYA